MPKFEVNLAKDGSEQWEEFIGYIQQLEQGTQTEISISVTVKKSRTITQNAALHQGFKHIACVCNQHGISKDLLFSKLSGKVNFSVTEEDVKEVCREVALSMFGKRTTTAIPSDQCGNVWEVLQKSFAQRLCVDIGEFPSLESLRMESMLREPEPCK